MKNSFTNIDKLIDFLKLDKNNQKKILKTTSFPLLLPYNLAKKIKKNDLNDPILRQFVPLKEENIKKKDFILDPLFEKKISSNNLIKKYQNRALLITSNRCAMHCRFCFRKHKKDLKNSNFEKEIFLIKKDNSIEEIILSGGDPLSLDNNGLKNLLQNLNKIPHLKRIRFHTRFILGFPNRINDEFIKILKSIDKQIIFVFHINHPNEIDPDIIKAISLLKKHKFLLFNQSVLLKNINDDLNTLKSLNELLISSGIVPYYIHQLDKVKGSKHFEVSKNKGKKLIKDLQESISGYICPKYVQDIYHKKSKTLI
jgi:EF-P beta-lysylation protein EpmB